jgi:hypothetical protein
MAWEMGNGVEMEMEWRKREGKRGRRWGKEGAI